MSSGPDLALNRKCLPLTSNRGGFTSAGEEDMLPVGADGGVVEGAVWFEKRAAQTFFMKRIHGGDAVGNKKKKKENADLRKNILDVLMFTCRQKRMKH